METNNINNTIQNNSLNSQNPVKEIPLPNSTAALVLGILSIALCWCYGIIGLILGIIGIFLGNNAKKLYKENPQLYTTGSYNNANAGFICSIIGTSLSAIFLIYVLIYIIFLGETFSFLTKLHQY